MHEQNKKCMSTGSSSSNSNDTHNCVLSIMCTTKIIIIITCLTNIIIAICLVLLFELLSRMMITKKKWRRKNPKWSLSPLTGARVWIFPHGWLRQTVLQGLYYKYHICFRLGSVFLCCMVWFPAVWYNAMW